MRQITGRTAIWLVLVLSAVSSFGQDRSLWRTAADVRSGVRGSIVGTVVDVDESRRQVWLTADDDRNVRINVATDSVSTQYTGFGGLVNGQSQVLTGSNGFTSVRLGDRLEVRGVGRANSVVAAEQIALLGRSTPVTSTNSSSPSVATSSSRIDGVIRQVNSADDRIVIETDRREMITIRTTSRTPVYYQNKTYEVTNLEQGDRVSVEREPGSANDREVRARSIQVIRSIQEGSDNTAPSVGSVSGKVTRVDGSSDTARIDTGREETRIDMSRAYDSKGRRVRATDLRVGDRVTLSGNYSGQVFMVTTVRYDEDVFNAGTDRNDRNDNHADEGEFVAVSMSATVVESLDDSPTLLVRDRKSGKTMNVFVTEDFVVKTKSGYTTADRLKAGDSILIKAYRDHDDNLIAQTIRYR